MVAASCGDPGTPNTRNLLSSRGRQISALPRPSMSFIRRHLLSCFQADRKAPTTYGSSGSSGESRSMLQVQRRTVMSSKLTLSSLAVLIATTNLMGSALAQNLPKCPDGYEFKCTIDGCSCPPHIKIPNTPPVKTGGGSKGACQTGNKAADGKCNQGRDLRKGGPAGSQ